MVNVGANATVDVRAATATLGTGSVAAGPGTVSVSVTGTLDVTFGTNFNKLDIKPGATVTILDDYNADRKNLFTAEGRKYLKGLKLSAAVRFTVAQLLEDKWRRGPSPATRSRIDG